MAVTTPAEPKKAADSGALLSLLGENELPLNEVTAAVPSEVLGRAWAAGDIEFGHSKYLMTGAPGGDPPNAVPKKGATLVLEGGVEWSGKKEKWHGRARDIIAAATMPTAEFYQRYQQEFRVARGENIWQWVEKDTDLQGREVRWVRRDCSKAEASALFGWFIRLTDKGLAQLQAE